MRVFEAGPTPGGGCRTAELTLPGFHHDVCSAVQALAELSPFFRGLDLAGLGVRLRRPEIAFAHPLDGGRAAAAYADVDAHRRRARARRPGLAPAVRLRWCDHADDLMPDVLGDLRHVPRHPLRLARFGLRRHCCR